MRLVEQIGGSDDLLHESHAVSLHGGNAISGKQRVEGVAQRHHARQMDRDTCDHGRRGSNRPNQAASDAIRMSQFKAISAATHGQAVQRGDDRLR